MFIEKEGSDDQSGAVTLNSGLTFSGNGAVTTATITITNTQPSDELLFTDTSKIQGAVTSVGSNTVLTLSAKPGQVPANADFEAALQTVKFNNASGNPDTTDRTIEFKVGNGQSTSPATIETVVVVANNDAPVFTLTVGVPVVEGDAATMADLVVATYTAPMDEEGNSVAVDFTVGSNAAGYYALDTATCTVTLTDAGASFVNGGGTLPAISLTATDGGSPAAASTQTATPVTTLVNDAPTVVLGVTQDTYIEKNGADDTSNDVAFGSSTIEIAGADGDTIANVTVAFASTTIQDGASEQLMVAGSSIALHASAAKTNLGSAISGVTYSVTVTKADTQTTVVFEKSGGGAVTHAQAEALLDALKYNNASNTPTAGVREFGVTVNDGKANSEVAFKTITVQPDTSDDYIALDTLGTLTLSGWVPGNVSVNLKSDPQTISQGSLPKGNTYSSLNASALQGAGVTVTAKDGVLNTLVGSAQADIIRAGNGGSLITGGAGGDTLYGGTGADVFIYTDRDESYYAGAGSPLDNIQNFTVGADKIRFHLAGSAVDASSFVEVLNFIEGKEKSIAYSTKDNALYVSATGTALNNTTAGAYVISTPSKITAGDLEFIITGTGAADILKAGAGNDSLTGGAGADVLTGGAKADKFIYTAVSDSAAAVAADTHRTFDALTDFCAGGQGNDSIDLSAINAVLTGGVAATGITVTALSTGSMGTANIATFAELAAAAGTLVASTGGAASAMTGLQAYVIDLSGNTGALGAGKYLLVNNGNTGIDANDLMIELTGTSSSADMAVKFILA